MSIFPKAKNITVTRHTPAQELKIELNGSTIKGEDVRTLMSVYGCDNTIDLQLFISEILNDFKISEPITASGKNLITADGRIIAFTDSSLDTTGPRYPFVTIINGNQAKAFSMVGCQYVPKHLEIIQNGKELTVHYPHMDNKTSIVLKQGNYLLNIRFDKKMTSFKTSEEMQQELLKLDLSAKPKHVEVYKLIQKYFNYPVTIELGILNDIFVYMFWRISVSGGECYYLFEAELSANNDGYESITTVNNKENSFRYEEPHTLEYSFKKGRFQFETKSEAFEDDFLSCKNKIAAFRNKMKHILE